MLQAEISAPARDDLRARRERRLLAERSVQMQRALAGVELQMSELRPLERLVVLNRALSDELAAAREMGVLAVEP